VRTGEWWIGAAAKPSAGCRAHWAPDRRRTARGPARGV